MATRWSRKAFSPNVIQRSLAQRGSTETRRQERVSARPESVQTLRIGSHRVGPWTPPDRPQLPATVADIGMPLGRPALPVPGPVADGLAADVAAAPDAMRPAHALPEAEPEGPSAAAASIPAGEAERGGGSTTSTSPGAAPHTDPAGEVDELARKLFEPLMTRLRAELLVERERRGLRTDAW